MEGRPEEDEVDFEDTLEPDGVADAPPVGTTPDSDILGRNGAFFLEDLGGRRSGETSPAFKRWLL